MNLNYLGGAALGLLPLGVLEAIEPTTDPAKIIPLAIVGVFLGLRSAARWQKGRANVGTKSTHLDQ
jgi:hypothetical protein